MLGLSAEKRANAFKRGKTSNCCQERKNTKQYTVVAKRKSCLVGRKTYFFQFFIKLQSLNYTIPVYILKKGKSCQ